MCIHVWAKGPIRPELILIIHFGQWLDRVEYNSGSTCVSNLTIGRVQSARPMSVITSWIVQQTSELKMSFKNFFWAKMSVTLFISFKNCWKQWDGSHYRARTGNWHPNHMGSQLKGSVEKGCFDFFPFFLSLSFLSIAVIDLLLDLLAVKKPLRKRHPHGQFLPYSRQV